jgi:hypothetical protein
VITTSCVVLVPYLDHIEPQCEEGLRVLEARGYAVRRWASSAAIDRARSEIATRALSDGYEELMWIDSDIGFDPQAVDRIREHGLPVVAGIYSKRGVREAACTFLTESKGMTLGAGGGLLEVRYVGTGFIHTRRAVYEDIVRKFALPVCNDKFQASVVPYFLPMILRDPAAGFWYLGEDYSFCERARQAGHKIMIDTTIRLWHYGRYGYSWEDIGAPVSRVTTAHIKFE